MHNVLNDYNVKTTDDTLGAVVERIEKTKNKSDTERRRAVKAVTRFHNENPPAYFKMYVRLFGKKPRLVAKKRLLITAAEIDSAKRVLGLNGKINAFTQNNVNLAYTKKSDENLPKRKSPKTQRALHNAYAKLTNKMNQSVHY